MVPSTSPATTIGTLMTDSQPSDLISSWSENTAAMPSMSLATKICLLSMTCRDQSVWLAGLVPDTG